MPFVMSPQRISQCLVGSRIKNCYLPFSCPLNSLNNRNKPTRFSKKSRLYSSKVTNHIGNHESIHIHDPSPSPMRQKFSFTDSEQRAFVEHIINLSEKAIYEFLVNNGHNI